MPRKSNKKRNPQTLLPDGTKIRRLRLEAGYTQETLAEAADISKKSVEDLESSTRKRPSIIFSVAETLGVDPRQIFHSEFTEGNARKFSNNVGLATMEADFIEGEPKMVRLNEVGDYLKERFPGIEYVWVKADLANAILELSTSESFAPRVESAADKGELKKVGIIGSSQVSGVTFRSTYGPASHRTVARAIPKSQALEILGTPDTQQHIACGRDVASSSLAHLSLYAKEFKSGSRDCYTGLIFASYLDFNVPHKLQKHADGYIEFGLRVYKREVSYPAGAGPLQILRCFLSKYGSELVFKSGNEGIRDTVLQNVTSDVSRDQIARQSSLVLQPWIESLANSITTTDGSTATLVHCGLAIESELVHLELVYAIKSDEYRRMLLSHGVRMQS